MLFFIHLPYKDDQASRMSKSVLTSFFSILMSVEFLSGLN